MNNVDIVPAVLEASLADIEARLAQVRGAVPSVQLDVVDGIFAPNRTWPYADATERDEFARIAAQEQGLPLWEDFDFEIDLMLRNPAREAERWIDAGAVRIVVHAESHDAQKALELLVPYRGEDDALGIRVGIAFSCAASASDLDAFGGLFDYVQVMGIARVGFQEQPFDERAILLVREIRAAYPNLPIQVDGGVSAETARTLVDAGANRLVAGSAIFGNANPRAALRHLSNLVNKR